jgi:hypothetical protein
MSLAQHIEHLLKKVFHVRPVGGVARAQPGVDDHPTLRGKRYERMMTALAPVPGVIAPMAALLVPVTRHHVGIQIDGPTVGGQPSPAPAG